MRFIIYSEDGELFHTDDAERATQAEEENADVFDTATKQWTSPTTPRELPDHLFQPPNGDEEDDS